MLKSSIKYRQNKEIKYIIHNKKNTAKIAMRSCNNLTERKNYHDLVDHMPCADSVLVFVAVKELPNLKFITQRKITQINS